MDNQLFRICSVDVPCSVGRIGTRERVVLESVPAFPFMYWPNGTPCESVNMYFLEIAKKTTGDTLITYASELSHLVRFCANNNIAISAFADCDFFEFARILECEKSKLNPLEHARNRNTVRVILSRAILFFQWYQRYFKLATETPLIGEARESPQIIVARVKNTDPNLKFNMYHYVHRAMPTSESREPKRPIALSVIEDIEKCIDDKSLSERQSSSLRNRPVYFEASLAYLRGRRHFMMWYMKRVGLRPSEMIETELERNLDVLSTKKILIPTKKLRRKVAPLRSFPVRLQDATVFHRYLVLRQNYIDVLRQSGVDVSKSTSLFLSVNGTPVKKASLARDFARLAQSAGYQDVQVCFSMFRHRFITYEVIAHIKEFMSRVGTSRHMMTETDYESILKRVAVKTGHKNVKSLWHYIDLAWDEIDVWGGVDRAISRLHAGDKFFNDLLSLQHDLAVGKASEETQQFVKDFTFRLGEVMDAAKIDFQSEAEKPRRL